MDLKESSAPLRITLSCYQTTIPSVRHGEDFFKINKRALKPGAVLSTCAPLYPGQRYNAVKTALALPIMNYYSCTQPVGNNLTLFSYVNLWDTFQLFLPPSIQTTTFTQSIRDSKR